MTAWDGRISKDGRTNARGHKEADDRTNQTLHGKDKRPLRDCPSHTHPCSDTEPVRQWEVEAKQRHTEPPCSLPRPLSLPPHRPRHKPQHYLPSGGAPSIRLTLSSHMGNQAWGWEPQHGAHFRGRTASTELVTDEKQRRKNLGHGSLKNVHHSLLDSLEFILPFKQHSLMEDGCNAWLH